MFNNYLGDIERQRETEWGERERTHKKTERRK
jgi:hypothetical protein